MNSMNLLQLRAITVSAMAVLASAAAAQEIWRLDTRGASGPMAQIVLPDSGTKRRTAFVAFEYARKCDPIFLFAEITGSSLGTPVGQSVLNGTKIGVVVNGQFWTGHAATTKYSNGYEAGFGVTNELFDALTGKVDSLIYVTSDGERVPVSTASIRQAVQSAFDTCAKRFR